VKTAPTPKTRTSSGWSWPARQGRRSGSAHDRIHIALEYWLSAAAPTATSIVAQRVRAGEPNPAKGEEKPVTVVNTTKEVTSGFAKAT